MESDKKQLISPGGTTAKIFTNSERNLQPPVWTSSAPHRRVIQKNGHCAINQPQSKRQRFDILHFTKLVGSSWSFTILIFLTTLLSSWLAFAVLYWLICYCHGDFEPNHLPSNQNDNNHKPCIYQINNFASCFLFSIETQHTVGYGIKATTDECPEAIFVNAFQCIIGFIMQGFMAVVIFAKMTLPRLRSKTLLFSRHAVICLRDNKLFLMFRVGDMRKNHIIDANVRAFFVRTTKTIEGEKLVHNQTELPLDSDQCKSSLFFNWPLVMCHKIDANSPLYYSSPSDMREERFEIVVVLEGTIESTGQMTQAKSSYIPRDILWGKKFETLLEFNSYRKEYVVDFSKFDKVISVSTPLCSAAYVDEYNCMQNNSKVSAISNLKLNFTPRQSIGDLPNYRKFSGGENYEKGVC